MTRQAAGHPDEEAAWGALAELSAALPHGLRRAPPSAASCPLTGECKDAALPGTAQHSVLEFSNEWYCPYLANCHHSSIYIFNVSIWNLQSRPSVDMMDAYVMGKKMVQRRNLTLPRRDAEIPHESVLYSSVAWSSVLFVLKCTCILDVKEYLANQLFNPPGTTW